MAKLELIGAGNGRRGAAAFPGDSADQKVFEKKKTEEEDDRSAEWLPVGATSTWTFAETELEERQRERESWLHDSKPDPLLSAYYIIKV